MALLGVAASEGTGEKAISRGGGSSFATNSASIDRTEARKRLPSFRPEHLSGARVKAPRQESVQSLGSGEK